MKYKFILIIGFIIAIFQCNSIKAQVDFPSFISDNMVLQRESEVPIWGRAKPHRSIYITCSWDNIKYLTTANENGKWMLKVKTPKAGGPYTIRVNEKEIKNIFSILNFNLKKRKLNYFIGKNPLKYSLQKEIYLLSELFNFQ